MKNIVVWFIERAKEKSTWYGIIALVSAAGVVVTPELKESIAVAGVALSAVIAAITKDNQ